MNLRELRIDLGLSVIDVANLLGFSRQSVYNWERGLGLPSTEDIEKFEEVYGERFIEAVRQTVKEKNDVQ